MLDPLSISIEAPHASRRPALPTRKLLQPSPDHPDDYILEIDNSSLEKFTTCPRAAENYLVRSREAARDTSATSFGSLFHSCEELRLRYGLSEEVKQKQRELVAQHFISQPSAPEDHRTAERMLAILKLYNERYSADRWPESVLKDEAGEPYVERAFKVKLMTLPIVQAIPFWKTQLVVGDWNDHKDKMYIHNLHVLYTGRIDFILVDHTPALWVVDHKTSSIGGKGYFEDFRLSAQTVGYVWAAQKILLRPISGLLLNSLIIRPLTKTGVGQEFTRNNYFYSEDRLSEWEENVKHIVSDFVSNLLRGYFPMETKWCMNKYGICEYHENCSLPRHQRSADLASELFRNVTWNPTNH